MAKPTDLVQGTHRSVDSDDSLSRIQTRLGYSEADATGLPRGSPNPGGSLYPALNRLEQQGWIESEWRPSETGRISKFYSLTLSGQRQFEAELASWIRLSAAINLVIQEA
jgi:hypothetical protein